MNNPNDYDDEEYLALTTFGLQELNLPSVLSRLWSAGASLQNIEDELESALSELLERPVSVEIGVAGG